MGEGEGRPDRLQDGNALRMPATSLRTARARCSPSPSCSCLMAVSTNRSRESSASERSCGGTGSPSPSLPPESARAEDVDKIAAAVRVCQYKAARADWPEPSSSRRWAGPSSPLARIFWGPNSFRTRCDRGQRGGCRPMAPRGALRQAQGRHSLAARCSSVLVEGPRGSGLARGVAARPAEQRLWVDCARLLVQH